VRVDDTAVERTVQRIAQENKLSPDEFRKVLERRTSIRKVPRDIRREITLQRLREREVESRVGPATPRSTSSSRRRGARRRDVEYLLSHILVTVPEQASPRQVRRAAAACRRRVAAGEDRRRLAQVAASFSTRRTR